MVKIYSHVAGNTLGSHERFLKKLKGAKNVSPPEKSDVTIVFCPIVSRFEADINAALEEALSKIQDLKSHKLIVVAMHHTFDPDYTLPNNRDLKPPVQLLVECLFYEDKGLFRCARNKKAYRAVRKELGLKVGGMVESMKAKANSKK